jgi:ATP-binding cassette subfamily B protein
LLLQPPILILDDPTASVDPKTEHEIVSALRHAMTGRTTFVVANRLSLLRRADVILVLEKGRLLQAGTHEQLLKVPGPYQETALLQLMDLKEKESKPASLEASAVSGARQIRPTGPLEIPAAQI